MSPYTSDRDPRKPLAPGLQPVQVEVAFKAPSPTIVQLQGPTLRAYYRWLEEPDDANLFALEEAIKEQCEHHILLYSSISDWTFES